MALAYSHFKKTKGSDEYATPPATLDTVFEYIDAQKYEIWEPFRGDGTSTAYMRSCGYTVHNGDNADFFLQTVPGTTDISKKLVMVTNPPFSKKKEILLHILNVLPTHEHALHSMALLLPTATIFNVDYVAFLKAVNWGGIFNSQTRFLVDGKPFRKTPFSTLWILIGECFSEFIDIEDESVFNTDLAITNPEWGSHYNYGRALRRGINYKITSVIPANYNFERRLELASTRRGEGTRDRYLAPASVLQTLLDRTMAGQYISGLPGDIHTTRLLENEKFRIDQNSGNNNTIFVIMTTDFDLEKKIRHFFETYNSKYRQGQDMTNKRHYIAVFITDMILSARLVNYVFDNFHPSGTIDKKSWLFPLSRTKFVLKETGEISKSASPFGTYWRLEEL
jgi:hypothetical protein